MLNMKNYLAGEKIYNWFGEIWDDLNVTVSDVKA